MADFVSAEITQEIIDAKNKLNQQADRAESLINSWETGGAGGDMYKATYDPTGVNGDAFKRSNMTGEQAISTITGLQTTLDSKANNNTVSDLADVVQSNTTAISNKASTTDLSQGLATKQATLVSGTNIKTINGEPLLGSGNITITSGGGGGAVDSVNGETGIVVLDAGDIAETASRIYFTPAEKSKLQGLENYTLPSDVVQDANYVATENSYTTAEKNKLAGIEAGAEVNTVSTVDLAAKEDSLGNPATDGQILASQTDGTRSWIDAPSGGGGDVRTPITLLDLSTTANILAKGTGKYYHTYEGRHYAMEIPTRRDWMIDIEVSPSGDGAYLKAVSLTQVDYGIYRKFIKNGSNSALCPWIKDKYVPINASVQASVFDMTDFSTILASMQEGNSFCGDIMISSNPTGGAGGTHRQMEIFYEGNSQVTRFEIVARGNKASPLKPKGRILMSGYDSGWIEFV